MSRTTALALFFSTLALAGASDPGGRHLVPKRWWETAPSICRVSLKETRNRFVLPIRDPARLSAVLDEMKAKGIHALEIFAPAEGGTSYGGLDTIHRYRIHPEAGTMDDFRRLVRMAHDKGLPIITFDNLGYSSVEADDFLKACDDMKTGRDSKEARFYLWSDSAGAPPPGPAGKDMYFMVRPTHLPGGEPGTFYDSKKHEFWQFSERAGRYYWTKWGGTDRAGNRVRLPQYNWGTREFQEEAEKIVRFWMETGTDGMIIDAVNWYVNYTWELGRRRITDVIASYGNAYSQPEGAGGFHEDPVPWITEGGWNSVQNYGLGIWWEKGSNVIHRAIETGDPRPIERALRDYRDRVAEAGGTLYFAPEARAGFKEPDKRRLAAAAVITTGHLVAVHYGPDGLLEDPEVRWLIEVKRAHPALWQLARRRQIPTRADDKHYAFLLTAPDNSERILVAMNFQPTPQVVEVDLSGVSTSGLVEFRTGAALARRASLPVELPAYGYRLFVIKPSPAIP